jgi:hypothetical protein
MIVPMITPMFILSDAPCLSKVSLEAMLNVQMLFQKLKSVKIGEFSTKVRMLKGKGVLITVFRIVRDRCGNPTHGLSKLEQGVSRSDAR